jgi:chaperone required for assembly of F1-ATPase
VKRFYKEVTVAETDGGWQVTLDGRAIKTQGGRLQIVPSPSLAKAMAAEWEAQGEELDPTTFTMRDATDYALDIAAPDPAALIATLVKYAETDTLCYRADPDDALAARQEAEWDPILSAIEEREGVRFTRIAGIMHQDQPNATLETLRAKLMQFDPFALAGLQTMASLATSFCIGLEALQEGCDPAHLWRAANLEELWQEELWGEDAEAQERRKLRETDFMNAYQWTKLARAN